MKFLCIAVLVFFASCGQTYNNSSTDETVKADSTSNTNQTRSAESVKLTDKTVKFLWRDNRYDEELKDTFNKIFINEDYCKTITAPERAALGYVATFIGNECWWDGEAKDDRSNLKCKILTALNLGYQCSERHLGFLRQWFRKDKKSLEELESCPTTPYTATIQDTFDEINIEIKGNTISVSFKANRADIREGESWSWSETDHFQLYNDNIKLIKKEESKVKHEHFQTGE